MLVVDAHVLFEVLARAAVQPGMAPQPVGRAAKQAKLPDADRQKYVATTIGILAVEIQRAEQRVKTGVEQRRMEQEPRGCPGLRAGQRRGDLDGKAKGLN